MGDTFGFRVEFLRMKLRDFLLDGEDRFSSKFAVVKIAKLLFPEEIRQIRSGRCPFCGRRFLRKGDVKQHLKRSRECSWKLWDLENRILEVYVEMRSKLVINGGYRLATNEGIVKFKHITEAAAFYVNHVLKVAQHG